LGVHKDVVLRELGNVFLELGEFSLAAFFLVLDAEGVQFALVGQRLIISVHNLPLLLKSGDQLVSLLVWEQESILLKLGNLLLSVFFVLFFDLHFPDELVLIFDLSLDLLEENGHFSVGFLLKVVRLGVGGEFGG
jgi:hypothetical protein